MRFPKTQEAVLAAQVMAKGVPGHFPPCRGTVPAQYLQCTAELLSRERNLCLEEQRGSYKAAKAAEEIRLWVAALEWCPCNQSACTQLPGGTSSSIRCQHWPSGFIILIVFQRAYLFFLNNLIPLYYKQAMNKLS